MLGSVFSLGTLFAGDLNWEKDLKSAFATAAKENKPLMVLVEGKHCRWCKKMKSKTLSNDSVSKRLQDFVLAKADKDDSETWMELPEVKFVPTIFFMTPERKVVERVTGYFNVEDFHSWIDDAQRDFHNEKKSAVDEKEKTEEKKPESKTDDNGSK